MGNYSKGTCKKIKSFCRRCLHGTEPQTRSQHCNTAARPGCRRKIWIWFFPDRGKTYTSGAIYFVIYKKHGTVVADTPFFSQVSEGISQGCKKNDYRLKISYIYEDEDTITKQIEEIQYSDCAGIILLGTEMEAGDLKPFLNLPIPVVLLDAYFETVPCNCVLINNVQGAYLAARHLIRTCKTQPGLS